MENSAALVVMLLTLPALAASIVIALDAKKTNAVWCAHGEPVPRRGRCPSNL